MNFIEAILDFFKNLFSSGATTTSEDKTQEPETKPAEAQHQETNQAVPNVQVIPYSIPATSGTMLMHEGTFTAVFAGEDKTYLTALRANMAEMDQHGYDIYTMTTQPSDT